MYVCMYVCMYVSMYVCIYVCMHVCMYICIYIVCTLFAIDNTKNIQAFYKTMIKIMSVINKKKCLIKNVVSISN